MSKRGLTNRTFLFSLIAILLVLSIFAVSSVSATSCGTTLKGTCKAVCVSGEQEINQGGDYCDFTRDEICCAPVGTEGALGAQAQAGTGKSSLLVSEGCDKTTGVFSRIYCVWFGGMTAKNFDLSGEVIKWIFLLMVIILIYSAMTYVKFPEGAGLRLLLAVIVGVLATFLITTEELVTILSSYTALGVTLTIFFPIAVLLFFTVLVASKASPIGIFVQKIMWIIYSVYLFFKTWTLYIISTSTCTINTSTTDLYKASLDACTEAGVTVVGWISSNQTISSLMSMKGRFDTPLLVLLLIVSIAVFIIMVISNKPVRAWLAQERFLADIEAQKDIIARSQALRREEAKGTRGEAGNA